MSEVYKCTELPLHPDLNKELETIRKRRNFNAKEWIKQKVDLFNGYMRRCGLKACVVNCSGGIDSSCTLALMKAAKDAPNSPIQKILGIAQPIHSTKSIQNRAYEMKSFAEIITVDQTKVFDDLSKLVSASVNIEGKQFAKGQLKSYMRTPVGFYVAQLLTQQGLPCVVIGTGNFDEDGYLYYFCKAGDGCCDIQLINELHKSEVFEVARVLGVPSVTLKAAPSADLWDGQTDEGELGFSYDFVELYTEYLNLGDVEREEFMKRLSEEAKLEFGMLEKKIVGIHRRNSHKENYPLNLNVEKYELQKERLSGEKRKRDCKCGNDCNETKRTKK